MSDDRAEFENFKKFPAELRLKIWKCALEDAGFPGNIVLHETPTDRAREPALFYVNVEAREFAIAHLKEYSITMTLGRGVSTNTFYADPNRDTICWMNNKFGNRGIMQRTRLAVSEARRFFMHNEFKHIAIHLNFFRNVTTLSPRSPLKRTWKLIFDNGVLETLDIMLPGREHRDGNGEENFSGFEIVRESEDFKVDAKDVQQFFQSIRSAVGFTWNGAVRFAVTEPKYHPRG